MSVDASPDTILLRTMAELSRRLAEPLPGQHAHQIAWPADLPKRSSPADTKWREASVLLVLLADSQGLWFPLLERPKTMPDHPGQVGLPGGGRNSGETGLQCALREANEEIGLDPACVQILGQLTTITIPVSRFRVEVFLAAARGSEPLQPRNREVQRLFRGRPELWQNGPDVKAPRHQHGVPYEAPAYAIEDTVVWGATALILAEFLSIWQEAGCSSR